MILENLQYPTKGKGLKRTIMTVLLFYPGFMLLGIPVFAAFGMFSRSLAARARGDAQPVEYPALTNPREWGGFLLDGLITCGLLVVYAGFPLVVTVLVAQTYLGGNLSAVFTTPMDQVIGQVPGILWLGLLALYSLSHAVIPAAIIRMEVETDGNFAAAFNVPAIADIITTRSYVIATLAGFSIMPVAALVIGAITLVTFQTGLLLVPMYLPWLFLFWAGLYGTAYRIEQRDTPPGEDSPQAADSVA